MHWIDASIFFGYLTALVGVGLYFFNKNKNADDYFVSGRNMSGWHIGLSVVATDVGGGFSIGLGGLGFTMGLSGSWLLFTGLLGAWITAVILIPRVYNLGFENKFTTFPQLFGFFYNKNVALMAGVISLIGYLGFTSSQILAGAKLASVTFNSLSLFNALIIMGVVTIGYTVLGGITAVIYTDTVQWLVLIAGLLFVGLPLGYTAVGGYHGIVSSLPPHFLSFTSVSWQTLVNWLITILPIWFVGMTLYQRIFASKSLKEAKKAWFIAGLFEWPVMAFLGVLLGLFSRVAINQGLFAELGYVSATQLDPELGLPLLLKQILPVGFLGIMLSVYFSAILSTADSCLMAASGNLVTDIIQKIKPSFKSHKNVVRISQLATLILGAVALIIAAFMENVLQLMLYSYSFMVSGLFVPLIGTLFFKQRNPTAAILAMLFGGFTTLILSISGFNLPYNLDANLFGIFASILAYTTVIFKNNKFISS